MEVIKLRLQGDIVDLKNMTLSLYRILRYLVIDTGCLTVSCNSITTLAVTTVA